MVQGNIPHLYMINIVYGYAMAHYSIAQFTLTTSINMDFKIKKNDIGHTMGILCAVSENNCINFLAAR